MVDIFKDPQSVLEKEVFVDYMKEMYSSFKLTTICAEEESDLLQYFHNKVMQGLENIKTAPSVDTARIRATNLSYDIFREEKKLYHEGNKNVRLFTNAIYHALDNVDNYLKDIEKFSPLFLKSYNYNKNLEDKYNSAKPNIIFKGMDWLEKKMGKRSEETRKFLAQQEFEENLKRVQDRFGFKNIYVEENLSLNMKNMFLVRLEENFSKIMQDFNLDEKHASIHGNLTVCYAPNHTQSKGVCGMALNIGEEHIMTLNYITEEDFKKTLLHEYVHVLDYIAGKKYIESGEILAGGFGSSLMLSSIISNSNINFREEALSSPLHNTMSKILTDYDLKDRQDSHSRCMYDMMEELKKVFLVELLKHTPKDYSSLNDNVKASLSTGFNIFNIIHKQSMEIIKTGTIDVVKYEVEVRDLFSNTIYKQLDVKNILSKLAENNECLIESVRNIVDKYSYALSINTMGDEIGYFATSKFARGALDFTNQENRVSTKAYYSRPCELLARYVENYYHNISTVDMLDKDLIEHVQLYGELPSEENKKKIEQLMSLLTSYLEFSPAPEKTQITENVIEDSPLSFINKMRQAYNNKSFKLNKGHV